MDKEVLQKMLEMEEEKFKEFAENVNAELAFRRGRIQMLAELLKEKTEESVGKDSSDA